MPVIYIIAGPPGIGKSTSGYNFIPENIPVLDPDEIAFRYKSAGFTGYKDIGNLRFNDLARKNLIKAADFAIELNLGFQSHYDFVKNLKSFNNDNTIQVLLYFTDRIEICLNRAERRHANGLHLVEPAIIREMYDHTLPLLQQNFALIGSLNCINVTASGEPDLCLEFDKNAGHLAASGKLPEWAESLKLFLTRQIAKRPRRGPR